MEIYVQEWVVQFTFFLVHWFWVRGSCPIYKSAEATVAEASNPKPHRTMRNELNTPLVNNGRNDDFLGDVYSFAKRTACQMLSTFDTIALWERDEIAEDAAVDVLGKLHRFDPNRGAKVTTWAYKVVERFILNRTESLKRRQFYTAVNRIDIDSPIGKLLPDEEPDDVETNEVRELVRTTLNSLPRKARQVADMMQEGRTTEEMTERLQITDGALYAHTFRIRNEVTSTLRKNGYMEGPVRRTRDRGTREGSAVLLLCTRLYQKRRESFGIRHFQNCPQSQQSSTVLKALRHHTVDLLHGAGHPLPHQLAVAVAPSAGMGPPVLLADTIQKGQLLAGQGAALLPYMLSLFVVVLVVSHGVFGYWFQLLFMIPEFSVFLTSVCRYFQSSQADPPP